MSRPLTFLGSCILVTAVIVCFASAGQSHQFTGISPAGTKLIANINGGAAAGIDDDDTRYYFLIVKPDGTMYYEALTRYQEDSLRDTLRDEYEAEVDKYKELRAKWMKAVGNKPFPVDRPDNYSIKKRGKLPTSDRYLEKAEERHEAELERYYICLLTNQEGTKTIEVIRSDRFAAVVVLVLAGKTLVHDGIIVALIEDQHAVMF